MKRITILFLLMAVLVVAAYCKESTSGDVISATAGERNNWKQKLAAKHDHLYWEFYEDGFKQAIRKDNWKAIRFYKGANQVRTELYDLSNDIGEQHELASQYPAVVKEMELLMDKEHIPSDNPLFQVR